MSKACSWCALALGNSCSGGGAKPAEAELVSHGLPGATLSCPVSAPQAVVSVASAVGNTRTRKHPRGGRSVAYYQGLLGRDSGPAAWLWCCGHVAAPIPIQWGPLRP